MPPKNRKVVVDEDSSDDMDESMEPSTSKPRRKPSPKKTKAPAPPADVEMEDVEDDLDDQHRLMEDYDDENLLNMAIPPQPEPCMSADGTGSRLMIRQIVANNFKSYYGPQRIGPFHKNFSAIIGPNGSGKSNVIDSLLFVFGFRAKKIRLKKIGELIHNSNGKDNLDFCSVEITFQKIIDKEDGDFDIVEGSVFSVARTAYKDNTSKYTINGKTKSIKDVVKKLREVGIDLIHNRFLILQGEVEHIALMKPKSETGKEEGMLEYLEDIIGSSRFKEPIDRLTKKLDSLSADRSQQTQKVKLADKERQAMEGPVREMIMFLRCENQVSLIKNKLFHIKLCKLQRQIQEKEPELVTMQEEKSNIEAEVKKLSDDRKETEKEVTEIETKRDTVQKELDVCYRSIAEMDAKEARRKLDLKKCAKDLANMRTNIEKEEANLQRINTVPAKSTAKIKLLEGTILELEEIIKENEAHVDNNRPRFEKKSVVLQADRQKAEEALGEKQRIVDEVNSKLTIAREELQLIVGENEKLSARLKEMHKQLDEHKSEFENKERELSELKLSIPETEKELANEREEVKNNKAKVDKLNFDLQGFRSKLGEDKAALSSHDQGNHTTRELTAAKERGEFTGFVGRLGDLGAIDPKYDAAISTTVSALHSYIVEKKADALVGVDICVKKKIGRTNFMIISEVPDCEDMINKPPQNFPAPRLFDLIKIPDPRLRKMFYSSIKDTLIVSDLSEAKKIANNCIGPTNYRYITLDGAVMDMNGTISGGGKPRRGAIGSQVNCTAELRKAQERIGSYQKSIDEATAEIQTYSEAIRKSDQKIFHLTASLNKMKERMRILNNEVPMLEGKVNNLEKQISFHEAQVGKLQIDEAVTKKKKDVVDQLEQEHEAAQEEFRTCKDKFDRAKDKFDALWKDLCGRFRDTADESKKKLEDTKTEIAKEQSKLKSFERDKNKAEERLSELKADLETKVKHETALIKTEGANESDLSAKHKLKKSLMTQIKELEDQLKKVRDSNSEMNEKEGNLQKSLLDMNEKLENLDLQIKALKTDSVGVKKQISALKLHNIKAIGLMPEKKNKKDDRADFLNDSLDLEEEQVAKQKEKKKQQKKAARRGGDDEAMDVDSEEKSGSDGDEDVDALPTFTEEELADVDRDDLKFKLGTLEQKISANKKDINMNILDDYANKVKKFEREKEYLDQIKKKYNDHLGFQDNLKKQRMAEFMEGFERIGLALKEMYQMITLGGDAALDLKDSIDPFSEGIQFMVRPPKKSWKNIENLSGGEKTLSSLALVFALHHYRPTPLYVMDEIDAALDFRNVSIIGHYIKDRTKNAQFIIISLRNNMFELGDRLIGIYKTFDCTKNVVVDPEKVIATANRLRAGVDAAYKGGILEGHQPMAIENSEASTSSVSTLQDKSQVADNSKSRKRQSTDAAVGGKKLDDRASPAHNKERRSRRKPKEKAEVEESDDDDLESDLEDDEDEL